MDEIDIEITDAPSDADRKAVEDGLLAYNEPFLGPRDARPIGLFVRRERGLLAGLTGETVRGILFIDMLWVAEAERRRGLGRTLLLRAEQEAIARGCWLAVVDTGSFQAPWLYRKAGYSQFAELDGLRNGHSKLYFKKTLAG